MKNLSLRYFRGIPLVIFIFLLLVESVSLVSADELSSITITYCDGSTQVVYLNQPASTIRGIEFSCPGSAPGGFGGTTQIAGGLKGDIFAIPENTARIPNLDSMTPIGSIYTRHLDIPSQSFKTGFPGVTDRFEWFAIRYRGTFEVPNGGQYSFRLLSDDGSRLLIDGQLVIDNDGLHPSRSRTGEVSLSAGTHSIRVEYFQGPRLYVALQLFVTPPNGSERLF